VKENNKEKEKEVKFCIQCGDKIPDNSTRYKVRKFCSRRCNRRYFSLRRYYKIKSSQTYKDYRKEYYKKWLNNNREKFNTYMRKFMQEAGPRYKKKKKLLKELNGKGKVIKKYVENNPTKFIKEDTLKKDIGDREIGIHDTIPIR